jgi:hypothetical protein
MSLRDFDREHAEFSRRMDRSRRRFMIVWWAMLIAIVALPVWALLHPEAIGAFFGRIAAGFQGAAR